MTMGGAILLSAVDSGFNNQIIRTLARIAPDINPATVLATGASEIRDNFPTEQIPLVLEAYVDGLQIVWAVGAAAFGVAAILGVFGSWKRMNAAEMKNAAGAAA